MMQRLTLLGGLCLCVSASACKEDEGAVELGKGPAAMGDADAPHRHETSNRGTNFGGNDAGMYGSDAAGAGGDVDTLVGAGGAASTGRDFGATSAEANWRPEGLRIAYSGPKLPCDGSLILKGSPIDKTTVTVRVVDVSEGRLPVDCMAPTTLTLVMDDVPRSVSTVRFYDATGAMQTLAAIGAKKP